MAQAVSPWLGILNAEHHIETRRAKLYDLDKPLTTTDRDMFLRQIWFWERVKAEFEFAYELGAR